MPSTAADYDIDCAVILCMAAGFPSEPSGTCSGAYDYMIDRITDRPPEPPFGAPMAAERVAFRFQITIPTGTAREPYVSPVFLSNPDTGFSLTLTADELRALEEQPTIPLETAP